MYTGRHRLRPSCVTQLAIAAKVPPEIIVMVLHEIPRHCLPPLDQFSSTTLASSFFQAHPLDTALLSAPLVCMSWCGPATEVLYEQINLQTMRQCEILLHTLQSNPLFGSWVKVLSLPSRRGRRRALANLPVLQPAMSSTTTQLLQLSADLFKTCNLVREINITAEASISYNLQVNVILIQAMSLCCRMMFSWIHPSTNIYNLFVSPMQIPCLAAQDQPTFLLCEN